MKHCLKSILAPAAGRALSFSLLWMMLATCAPIHAQQQPAQPNVLMIIVDDFGWRDLHAYGSDFYETPNFDKLIDNSLKFNQAYSSYPRCVPSRYSIMTGSYPARRRGDGGDGGYDIEKPTITLGHLAKQAGYQTFYIGKWHLGSDEHAPSGEGFDRSVAAGAAGATSSHFAPYNEGRNGTVSKEAPIPDLGDAKAGENLEDRLTAETIRLLATRKKDQPVFGILAHYAVHTPIQGKPEYVQYFKEKLKKNPPPAGPDYEPESAGENKLKQDNAVYAAMIKAVDDGIGRILHALDSLGMAGNTMIIVTSDHGGLSARGNNRELATTNRPLRAGKGHLYEGGIRVPLFVCWPGKVKPGTTEAQVLGTDHFWTLAELWRTQAPSTQLRDGLSYLPVLHGEKSLPRTALYWHNWMPRPVSTADIYTSAIRVGDFKLVDRYADKVVELYDLQNDLGERNNIASQHPDKVKALYKQLNDWRKQVNADMQIKAKFLSEKQAAEANIPGKEKEQKKPKQ